MHSHTAARASTRSHVTWNVTIRGCQITASQHIVEAEIRTCWNGKAGTFRAMGKFNNGTSPTSNWIWGNNSCLICILSKVLCESLKLGFALHKLLRRFMGAWLWHWERACACGMLLCDLASWVHSQAPPRISVQIPVGSAACVVQEKKINLNSQSNHQNDGQLVEYLLIFC